MTTDAVLQLANRFVDRVEVGNAPIDTMAVARTLGLTVTRETMDPEITGALVTTPRGPGVVLNSRQPPNRQRVALAHMIGHLQLGHRLPSHVHVERRFEAYRDERRYSPVERLEFEANLFAGSLLMPTRMLRKALTEAHRPPSDDDVQQMALRFGVSVQGMMWRLTRAGFL